jgi:hypothetical protein
MKWIQKGARGQAILKIACAFAGAKRKNHDFNTLSDQHFY